MLIELSNISVEGIQDRNLNILFCVPLLQHSLYGDAKQNIEYPKKSVIFEKKAKENGHSESNVCQSQLR